MYSHVGWERSWRGAIHFDKKSCITIMEVSPLLARKQILAKIGS
jgi:hypothetical protein